MAEPIVVAGKTCYFIASAVGGCTISDRDDYNGSFLSDGKWGHFATVFRDEAAARSFAAACAAREAAQEPPSIAAQGSEAFGCVKNTIRLRSGCYFDFINPQPDQFTLEDIAGALAKICRFGGQCPQFYSVAEHSVHCAWQAYADGHDPETCMAVLFHDAPEAFCGDVVKPLKIMLSEYKGIEHRVEQVIGDALDIDFNHHAKVIREIDHAMLIAERRALFSADGVTWFGENEVRRLSTEFKLWPPDVAEAEFLKTADELTGVSKP
jgi:5'-deoxynucleotidase YfbR-like HD superfamily hydrolase